MHNDRVIARINKKAVGGKRSEGEIIKIVKRANKTVVGTFESSKNFGFVIPDDKRISGDIYLSLIHISPCTITPHWQIKKGDIVNLSVLCMGSHTGTHIDAPNHFIDQGKTIEELPLALPMKCSTGNSSMVLP